MKADLRKEKRQLKGEYKKIYSKIFIYLSSYCLNQFAKEELELEIVGICLENQKRNIPMSEVFDNDYKAFCDTLITTTKRQTSLERFLYYILLFISVLAFYFTVYSIFSSLFQVEDVYMKDFVLHMNSEKLYSGIGYVFITVIANMWVGRRSFEDQSTTCIKLFIAIFITYVLVIYVTSQEQTTMITISLPQLLILYSISAILYFAYYRLQKKEFLES